MHRGQKPKASLSLPIRRSHLLSGFRIKLLMSFLPLRRRCLFFTIPRRFALEPLFKLFSIECGNNLDVVYLVDLDLLDFTPRVREPYIVVIEINSIRHPFRNDGGINDILSTIFHKITRMPFLIREEYKVAVVYVSIHRSSLNFARYARVVRTGPCGEQVVRAYGCLQYKYSIFAMQELLTFVHSCLYIC